jgi:small-conductance mechanosensitive channel
MVLWSVFFGISTGAVQGNGTNSSGGLPDSWSELTNTSPAWAWDLGLAVAVLLVSWYVSKLAVRLAGRPVARRFERPSVTRTVLKGIQTSVMLFGAAVAANILNFEIGDILLSVTVFSAVVAVVLAPIVGSFISGLFVLADQPFEIGDMIELVDEGTSGYVEDITLRYTKLFTLDNSFIVVPNSMIRDRDIINYSAEDPRTRYTLSVIVTYEGDLEEARSLIEQAAKEVDGVIKGGPAIRIGSTRYPAAPTCYIDTFGDHGVELALRYWAEEPYRPLTVRSAVQTNVWDRLEDADVEIAYPHSHLVFDETSGEAAVSVRSKEGPGPHHSAGPQTTDQTASDDGDRPLDGR